MYAKLFSRITESSLMEEPINVRYVFVLMLAIADAKGYVIGTDVAIARRLNMPTNEFLRCVEVLMKPDEDSNSKEEEGRRIVGSDGERGYRMVNYLTYREMQDQAQRREYMRNYMQEYRGGKRRVNSVNKKKQQLTQAEGSASASSSEGASRGGECREEGALPAELDTPDFRTAWGKYEAYRVKRKFKPLLPDSVQSQFKILSSFGSEISILAIESTIANGWQGIFPEKITPPKTNGHKHGSLRTEDLPPIWTP